MMLNFQVWRKNGTREYFLMHVTVVLNAIKKCGHFYDYKKAVKDHEESTKAVESARAALSLLDRPGAKAKKSCKKRTKEVKKDATAKVQDSKRIAKGAMTVAANKMFAFYRTCFLQRVSTLGTRSSANRRKVTRTSTYKVTPWKAQGECLASRLTIA